MFLVRGFKVSKLTTSILSHLRPFKEKQAKISEQILNVSIDPSKSDILRSLQIELSSLETYSNLVDSIDSAISSLNELEQMKADKEMAEAASEEYNEKISELEDLELQAVDMLIDKDPDDESSVIVEIKPGVGGSESSLFSEDLLNMYMNYAMIRKWKVTTLEKAEDIQIGKGVKDVTIKIEGKNAYSVFKYECGVHKVIRVPQTEKSGRLHSSTSCVIVLPDKPPPDFKINEKDIKIDVMRARGPGGQHVNKTESAVRATHMPTGLETRCQETRSQLDNRVIALEILYARVYDHFKRIKMLEDKKIRKELKGHGDRSEKIRTYNFPQDRITDHRYDLTLHGIDNMIKGLLLDQFVDAAEDYYRKKIIDDLINSS